MPDDATASDAEVEQTCFHCGLPVPRGTDFSTPIKNISRPFCCQGCLSVCKIIYDAGLEGFYDRTPDGQLLAPPPEPPKDIDLFDIDEVQKEYVQQQGQEREIHLLVEGIHCAACIWLIERSLMKLPGVIEVNGNLANKKVQVRWNNQQIRLSDIIRQLSHIGYAGVPYDPDSAEGIINKQNRALLLRMAFAGFAMMNLLWVSIALYTGADKGEFRSLFHWVGFSLATPTLLYSGWPFLKGAWTGLRKRHLTMDLPIALGATTTYLYSVFITITQSAIGEVYFDTVVNFLFVILVGRFLEAKSKRHAIASTQRLINLQPKVAKVIRGEDIEIIPVKAIKPGETVLIKPGDHVPVDGKIIDGDSEINESMLSGESLPVHKHIGDKVHAGTINTGNTIKVQVETILSNTTLGKIIHLIEHAQATRAPIQCIADRIVPWFVGVTLLLAGITFLWWLPNSFEHALLASTSVLIITCPCAFGLATPMAIAVASGVGAQQGILIKNGAVLEYLSGIKHFVFDKTGTLTRGKMQLRDIQTDNGDANELLTLVAAVENLSEHTIAKAITEAAQQRKLAFKSLAVSQFINQPGFGVMAKVEQQTLLIGNQKWLQQHHVKLQPSLLDKVSKLEQDGITCVQIALDNQHQGFIAIADELRQDAAELITHLKQQQMQLVLLSGDRQAVADATARELGGMKVIAEVLPDQKQQVIRSLQQQAHQVAMVGDGVNDAPALMQADIGIALGSGTDVSMDSADIILLNDELNKVKQASELSRRTLRTIKQNIGLSIAYNLIMVPLAMAGFITPVVAAVSMPFSSLAVIFNAARIRNLFRKR